MIQLRCSWCKSIIRSGIVSGGESHGICQRCAAEERKKLAEYRKEKERQALVGVEGTPAGSPVQAEPMFGSYTEAFVFFGKLALGMAMVGFILYIAMAKL